MISEYKAKRDNEIRADLVDWLMLTHQGTPDVRIYHEFKVRSRSARADLVLLNGEMAGYEIKSDADTVVRLHKQVHAFSSVMDKVIIVVTDKNIEKSKVIIPEWCGLIHYIGGAEEKFRVIEEPKPCPDRDAREVATLLSAAELYQALKRRGFSRGLSKAPLREMIEAFVSFLNSSEQRADILTALKARVDFSEEMKVKYGH